jgi:hypothetical protein
VSCQKWQQWQQTLDLLAMMQQSSVVPGEAADVQFFVLVSVGVDDQNCARSANLVSDQCHHLQRCHQGFWPLASDAAIWSLTNVITHIAAINAREASRTQAILDSFIRLELQYEAERLMSRNFAAGVPADMACGQILTEQGIDPRMVRQYGRAG